LTNSMLKSTSTVISQVILTCGGSSIPFVLSSMLAELLPFLRNIASAIQDDLGVSHPGVLPTTMTAFSMTSILLGLVFLLLAALRCGNLVGYFPETVMKGVVGMSTHTPRACVLD
jgi:MFS superfamily sulfate permease-like transporter